MSIHITDSIKTEYDSYMREVVDYAFNGTPITRLDVGEPESIVTFAGGYQAAKHEIAGETVADLKKAYALLFAENGRLNDKLKELAWQPIGTAPKDGTMILLGRTEDPNDDSGSVSTAGRWQEGWEDSIDDMGCDDGFVDVDYQEFSSPRSFGATAYRSMGRQPTHWMLLPTPPSMSQEKTA